jgi:hypothetical protein
MRRLTPDGENLPVDELAREVVERTVRHRAVRGEMRQQKGAA